MRRRARSLGIPLVLLAACGSETLAPKMPVARREDAPRLPRAAPAAVVPSVIDAPISYALAPILAALEDAVPRRFGNIDQRRTVPGNSRQAFAFAATRSPFAVGFDGTRLTLSTDVSYEGRGWYNPMLGPTVSASCGTEGRRPRLHIELSTDLEVTPVWALRAKSRLRSLKPRTDTDVDACRVTMFKIDVTDRVVAALRPQLTRRLPAVDRRIASFDLRTRVERWHNVLNRSIRVRDSLWLRMAPEGVRLGGLRLDDSALVADIRLYARPTLVTGARPADIITALPALRMAERAVGDSAHLVLEGLLSYDAASTVIAAAVVGRSYSRLGRRITVRRARLAPLNDGRVMLALGVSGAATGDAYLVGTPQVDRLSGVLSVPDLDFDVETSSALVSGLAWLKKGEIVGELRRRAQVPLQAIVEEARERAEQALNRDLTDGVRLTASILSGRVIDVFADPTWLVVRAEARGTLRLGIDRELQVRTAK